MGVVCYTEDGERIAVVVDPDPAESTFLVCNLRKAVKEECKPFYDAIPAHQIPIAPRGSTEPLKGGDPLVDGKEYQLLKLPVVLVAVLPAMDPKPIEVPPCTALCSCGNGVRCSLNRSELRQLGQQVSALCTMSGKITGHCRVCGKLADDHAPTPKSSPEREDYTFESMLLEAGICSRREVILRAKERYASQISVALATHDVELAQKMYYQADLLPSAHTERLLKANHITLGGPLVEGSGLTICHDDAMIHFVLKPLEQKEYARAKVLLKVMQEAGVHEIPHVTNFRIFSTGDEVMSTCFLSTSFPHDAAKIAKYYMLMPKFSATLETIRVIHNSCIVLQLWEQLSRGLGTLHKLGFAHMDVKPANIAVSEDGTLYIIDVNSTEKFGCITSSTKEYIPTDLRKERTISSPLVDWGMLAATMCEMCCGNEGMSFGFTTPHERSLQQMIQHLERFLKDDRGPDGSSIVVRELQKHITLCSELPQATAPTSPAPARKPLFLEFTPPRSTKNR